MPWGSTTFCRFSQWENTPSAIVVTLSGSITVSIDTQKSNALRLMVFTLWGSISTFSALHARNASAPINTSVSGRTIFSSERQEANAPSSINFNPSGRLICVSLSHQAKAFLPIDKSLSGSSTPSTAQFENAFSPIDLIYSGTLVTVAEPIYFITLSPSIR